MVVKSNKYLGNGLYTIAEAALYCRVSTSMMGRWLFGTANGRRVIDPEGFSGETNPFVEVDVNDVGHVAARRSRIVRWSAMTLSTNESNSASGGP